MCSGIGLSLRERRGTAQNRLNLADILRPTSEVVARRRLRSADTTTLLVPPTQRLTNPRRPSVSGGCDASVEQSAAIRQRLDRLITVVISPADESSSLSSTTTTKVLIIVTLHKVAGALYISDLKKKRWQ